MGTAIACTDTAQVEQLGYVFPLPQDGTLYRLAVRVQQQYMHA